MVLYRPQQIDDFLLPIAERVLAAYTTVFKGILHTTQVALRNLPNTTVFPTSKERTGLTTDPEIRVKLDRQERCRSRLEP